LKMREKKKKKKKRDTRSRSAHKGNRGEERKWHCCKKYGRR